MNKYLITKWVIAILLFGYMLIGCFPFAPLESDSAAISNGADYMIENGIKDNFFAYRYHTQPGTYALITWFSRITGFSAFISFSILSLIAALGFIGIVTILLAKYADTSFINSIIFLLLFQEIFAESYYPSSTVLAGFVAITAFLLLLRKTEKNNLIASILFAVAVWIRFDVIISAPLFLIQFFWLNPTKRFKRSILIVISLIIILLIYHLSQANLAHMMRSVQEHIQQEYYPTTGSWLRVAENLGVRCHLSLLSFLMIIAFIGGMVRVAREKPKIFFYILIGLIPFYLIFWGKITTPKYLYYYIPLFTLPSFIFLKGLLLNRKPIILVAMAIILLQYVVGVRIDFKFKPHRTVPYPTIVKLLSIPLENSSIDKIDFVIGAGIPIPTDDLNRMSSGIFFAPLFWNQSKRSFNDNLEKTKEVLCSNENDSLTIITTRYSGFNTALRLLTDIGFECFQQESSEDDILKTCILTNDSRQIKLVKHYYDISTFKKNLLNHCFR